MGFSLLFLERLTQRRARFLAVVLAAFTLFFVLFLYYSQNAFLEAFEARTYDLRFKELRGKLIPFPEIAIIAIDEKSIAELGRFPWSRDNYARLIEKLSAARAKALLFDAFFPEPESVAHDAQFAAAIRRSGRVALATMFEYDAEGKVQGRMQNLPVLERSVVGLGHINLLPDEDGVNRRSQLVAEYEGRQIPSLGLLGAMLAMGERSFEAGAFDIKLGDRHIPVGEANSMWINYMGPPGIYPRYSFVDVARGRIAPEMLRGKILFVGATALGVYDMRVTPFSGNTPGVELHAAIADNILSGRFLRQGGLEALIDMMCILLLGGMTFWITLRQRILMAAPAVMALLAGYVWFTEYMFGLGHWINMVYPMLGAVGAMLVGGGFRYLVLERRAREMRQMFSSYLSPKLVARLERDPDAAKIGGDNREVTVMFSDIKDFTVFSEQHPPQEVVARLNEYLAAMVHVIEAYDGTVDKFIGDGIMAYWGAPLRQPEHARLAMACVEAMGVRMKELQAEWRARGVEVFTIRIGMQSGEVVAGNIGFAGRKMEYTVIGDTVNLAARLEATAKFYGVAVIVGEDTYQQTQAGGRYRELDRIRVVGKDHAVTIYEPLGEMAVLNAEQAQQFESGLAFYRARKWDEAEQVFRRFPDDGPSRLYVERCERFRAAPPAGDWDGVYQRAEK